MLSAYNESPLLKRNRTINLAQNYESPSIYAKKQYNESEVLRERSSNISQMLHEKCNYQLTSVGNQKKSTLIPKSYHPKQ
jgi:hypothetical protein